MEILIDQNNKLNELVQENQRLLSLLSSQYLDTNAAVNNLVSDVNELKGLKTDVLQVATSVSKLTCSVENQDGLDSDDEDEEEEDDAQPQGTLLIGDSLLRSLESTAEDLKITCQNGAKLCDLKKTLKQLNPKKQKYSNLYIICRTNDIATKKAANKIADEFKTVLQIAKEKAENVCLCSILPRSDNKADIAKIDDLNRLIRTMATELQVECIDNDKNFRFQDGSVDETTLAADQLHLSAIGCQRLLQNLKLHEKAKVTIGGSHSLHWQNGNAKETHQNQAPQTWKDPLPVPPKAPVMQERNTVTADSTTNTQPIKFRGSKCTFSNFYGTNLWKWGIQFASVEHAYNYRKAIEMGQHVTAESIRSAPTPRQSQIIAEEITTDERWKQMKQSVMYDLLQEKSQQCQVFRNDLSASKDRLLVEDTSHEYWGRGYSGTGLNMLGRLLMTLRDNLPPATPNPYRPPRNQHRQYFPKRNDLQPRCFNCGEKSHNVKTCRHPAPLQCYACLNNGHKQKFCPNVSQH